MRLVGHLSIPSFAMSQVNFLGGKLDRTLLHEILIYCFSGKPYLGKPSDMWALGVVLFTMLYGQFPFYDSAPQELFRKIKAAEFSIPK